jgi:hypothetical protein
MKKPREPSTEIICPACDGTGFQKLKQPTQPGRKVDAPKCAECLGKGRIRSQPQSWIDPRRPSVRASPSTFATGKAVSHDTVIGKRIS